MLRATRRRRAFAVIWAMLQLALPAVGALAEAGYAASSSPASLAHVEDRSGPDCRPVHAPDCALCQALSTQAGGVPTPAVDWTLISAATTPAYPEGASDRGLVRRTLPLSRAPPLFF